MDNKRMKHVKLLGFVLILLVLSVHSVNSARLFISTEPTAGLSKISKSNVLSKKVGREGNTGDNPWQLMGMEDCKNGDVECEKRRLLSEAHLDYIYTQVHHKP